MSILFTPTRIRNLEIKNRFVRSATYDGCADRYGHVTEHQLKLFQDLAQGGIGLIISGIAYVHSNGRISPRQNAIHKDDFIKGLKQLTDLVHQYDAKIAVQLFHAGREAGRFKPERALAPSLVENDPYCDSGYRAMTEEEILETVQAFGQAAGRAREAGFDAVQVHGAHAYLVSQFLSPFTNQRTDGWGGDPESRLRFHKEIYSAIRAKVGPDYPVLIKIGVEDGFPGGLSLEEGLRAARTLAREGYDSLEISSGLRGPKYQGTEFRTGVDRPGQEAYFRAWAAQAKNEVDVPVMMVGGLRSFEMMEEIITNQEADLISLCRPLIREPGLVRTWMDGRRRRPDCISCNQCYENINTGAGLACLVEQRRAAKQHPGLEG